MGRGTRFLWTAGEVTEVDGLITHGSARALKSGASWPELMSGSIADAKQWLTDNGYGAVQVIESAGDAESVCDAVVGGPTNCCGYVLNKDRRGRATVTLTACSGCAAPVYAPDSELEYAAWPGTWYAGPEPTSEDWAIPFMTGGAMGKSGSPGTTWNDSHTFLSGVLTSGHSYRWSMSFASKYSRTDKEIKFHFYDDASDTTLLQTVTFGPFDLAAKTPASFEFLFTLNQPYHHAHGVWPTYLTGLYKGVVLCDLDA